MSVEMKNHFLILQEPKREIEAILFDMDGVLADSIPTHILAWNSALCAHLLPEVEESVYDSWLGRTNQDIIDNILEWQRMPLPLSQKMAIVETKELFFRNLITDKLNTTPGVIPWLEFFKRKQVHCSVASSGDMANIAMVLDTLHISGYFTSIISGAHLPASKPDPLIFKMAAASLGVGINKCLVIEDAPAGIQAAKNAGMVCCAIATTLPKKSLDQADIVLNDLSQISPETLFSDPSLPL